MNRFQKNLAVQPAVIRLLAVCAGLVLSVVAFGFGLVDASPAKAAEEAETVKQSEPEEKSEEKAEEK
ncbi:MAG TPA: hypothetical protein DCE43_21565, partial [Planctomycetaceae bacterium]|nr:hypothetical protein [Planctomycetaceae bacterium]